MWVIIHSAALSVRNKLRREKNEKEGDDMALPGVKSEIKRSELRELRYKPKSEETETVQRYLRA